MNGKILIKTLTASFCLWFATNAFAGWEWLDTKIVKVGSTWGDNNACVYLENEVILLDLSTEKGKAELSLAIAAKLADSDVRVLMETGGPLFGGCNQGDIHRNHGFLILK